MRAESMTAHKMAVLINAVLARTLGRYAGAAVPDSGDILVEFSTVDEGVTKWHVEIRRVP